MFPGGKPVCATPSASEETINISAGFHCPLPGSETVNAFSFEFLEAQNSAFIYLSVKKLGGGEAAMQKGMSRQLSVRVASLSIRVRSRWVSTQNYCLSPLGWSRDKAGINLAGPSALWYYFMPHHLIGVFSHWLPLLWISPAPCRLTISLYGEWNSDG